MPRDVSVPLVPVCGIGASAGGIDALQQLFGRLSDDLGLAYVVILHLAPDRKSELPAIISRFTRMPVLQVADHETVPLARDHVYVIAPDRKLEITETAVGAAPFEQPRGQRSAIDLFFRSLAVKHGDGFAVVLSGTGTDGAMGAKAVKESGGVVLVQDPEDALHGDMPRAAIATGVADIVLPVREIAARLSELARSKKNLVSLTQAAEHAGEIPADEEKALRKLLELLHKHTGHDFSKYKRTTVLRRLSRRMQLSHQLSVSDYLSYVRTRPNEIRALFDDLLISVTMFFRDPESWDALQREVIAKLVDGSDPDEQIRAWVPGCATGEEAYTLAILFLEELERRSIYRNLLIFASDVDESALDVARAGIYPHAIRTDVSEARLARYFHLDNAHYRVVSEVRDHMVFAEHSLLRDPPFSRMHVISCRNLLIYLDRELQEQVIGVFRYACRDNGYLFLGAAEIADEDLFRPLDKKHKIFSAQPRGEGDRPALPEILAASGARTARPGRDVRSAPRPTAAEVHIAILEELAPPSALVDERWNVLHVSGTAARFIQQSGGVLARRLTELVRPELRDELHAVLNRVAEKHEPQLSPFVAVGFDGAPHRIAPRAPDEEGRRHVLVLFLDAGQVVGGGPPEVEPSTEHLRDVREKLRRAEQRIDTMRDDHFLTTEDLRAANEELQSLNEEYRSTTEELETSKEELQSINEELQTVNHQLSLKLDEISHAHSDLENLMAATDVATLFLSRDLRIKRFTPQLAEIFKIKTRDQDRPISDITHTLDYKTLEEDARHVLRSLKPIARDARSSATGRQFVLRLSPYRVAGANDVDGIVITFIDVTQIKQAEVALRESERKLEAELNVLRRLHRMTLSAATARSMGEALDFVLDAAIELHGADLGNVQMVDPGSEKLRIVAQRGFGRQYLARFAEVGQDDPSGGGRALRERKTCAIGDVNTDPDYAPLRELAAEAGYRAVLLTPLLTRDGVLVGVLSVHFRQPHSLSERDTQLSDLFARQAADLIAGRAQQDGLARLNEVLIQRTSELEASQQRLAAQADELLEQDRHREEFLAALGHELRNPMSAMQSSIGLMTASDDRSRWALGVLQRQIDHMTRLVNDLLDVTRVKHGRLRLERTMLDLHQSVLAAVESARQQAESKGLVLEYVPPGEPVAVEADPERLAQILDNLLRNAVTYTDEGAITVSVLGDTHEAVIEVRDTGVGIAPDDAKVIFQPYQQRQAEHRSTGLGLGLTLVKTLVEAHGGRISVHSEGRNKGSEFCVTLPRVSADAVSAPARARMAPKTSRRILVVDDQQDVADVFAALLQGLGQRVEVAYDGTTALRVAAELRPEVAFLDISMPQMSGPELAAELRRSFPRSELTLVAVTGFGITHPAAQSDCFDYRLMKPVTGDALAALLEALPVGAAAAGARPDALRPQ